MATSSEDWIKCVYALENNTKCTHFPGIKIEYYKYLEQRLPSFYVCIKHWEILLNADSASEGLRLGVGSAFPSDLEVTLPGPGPHVEQQRFMIPDMPFLSHIPLFPLPFLL